MRYSGNGITDQFRGKKTWKQKEDNMAHYIRYDTDRIRSDAAKVSDCIGAMRKSLSDLRTHEQELDAMWDGDSSEAFKAVFYDDLEILDNILGNLERIYEYEVKAETGFTKCNSQVSEIISSLRM